MKATLLSVLQAFWPLFLSCLALAGESSNGSPKWMQNLGGGPWSCQSNKEENTQPKSATGEVRW